VMMMIPITPALNGEMPVERGPFLRRRRAIAMAPS
jgi:hypothetical protein